MGGTIERYSRYVPAFLDEFSMAVILELCSLHAPSCQINYIFRQFTKHDTDTEKMAVTIQRISKTLFQARIQMFKKKFSQKDFFKDILRLKSFLLDWRLLRSLNVLYLG